MRSLINLFALLLSSFGPVYLIVYLIYRAIMKKKLSNKYKIFSAGFSLLIATLIWGAISASVIDNLSSREEVGGAIALIYLLTTFVVTYKFFYEKGVKLDNKINDLKN